MKSIDFVIEYVDSLKKSLKRIGSYTDSPDWIKNKEPTINHAIEYDDKGFTYAAKRALNHEEIGKHSQRMPTVSPFTENY